MKVARIGQKLAGAGALLTVMSVLAAAGPAVDRASAAAPSKGGTTTTETTTTSTEGTVTTFEPGKTIVVRRSGVTDPTTYTLGKTVTYVSKSGKVIEPTMIKAGVPVHVYYDAPGSTTVTKVVVDQD